MKWPLVLGGISLYPIHRILTYSIAYLKPQATNGLRLLSFPDPQIRVAFPYYDAVLFSTIGNGKNCIPFIFVDHDFHNPFLFYKDFFRFHVCHTCFYSHCVSSSCIFYTGAYVLILSKPVYMEKSTEFNRWIPSTSANCLASSYISRIQIPYMSFRKNLSFHLLLIILSPQLRSFLPLNHLKYQLFLLL